MKTCNCKIDLKKYREYKQSFEISCKNKDYILRQNKIFVSGEKDEKGYFIKCPNCGEKIYKQKIITSCPLCKNKNKSVSKIFPDISKTKIR